MADTIVVTFLTEEGRQTSLHIDVNLPLSAISEIIQVEFDIPPQQQLFILNGNQLDASKAMKSYNLTSNDAVLVRRRQGMPSYNSAPQPAQGGGTGLTSDMFKQMMQQAMSNIGQQPQQSQPLQQQRQPEDPAVLMSSIRADADLLSRARMNNPPLYEVSIHVNGMKLLYLLFCFSVILERKMSIMSVDARLIVRETDADLVFSLI